MNFHVVEALSEYLDGRLGPSAAAELEVRLRDDRELQATLNDLRMASTLIRAVPARKAPRNFTLRPGMRGLSAPTPPAFPVLRLASVMASLLFLGTVAINTVVPLAARQRAAAPVAGYGLGGGGGAAEVATPMPPAAAAPLATAPSLLAAAPSLAPEPTQAAPDLQAKSLPQPPAASQSAATPQPTIPAFWQWILAGLALILAVGAWVLNAAASRRFRRQTSGKSGR